ncbi:MAG: hypothetical protein JWP84_2997 [Tardiphaga sp.]|nr:hypothetical protein [Tardiphaga sp.]
MLARADLAFAGRDVRRALAPLITCGRNSLQVFCLGIVLSFCAHAAIELSLNALSVQIFVGATGVLLMTASAYFLSWSRQQDRLALFVEPRWPMLKRDSREPITHRNAGSGKGASHAIY